MKNVFILGLDETNRQMLKTIRGADTYRFYGLLSETKVVHPATYPVKELLQEAREQLEQFDGSVDAIIGHWDFPTTSMLPVLQRERGLSGPSLESALKCDNKYWSRIEQERAAPEETPAYQGLDPFDEKAAEKLELDFPFWLKPVVAFSSYLGFRIENQQELRQAIETIRKKVGTFGEPFDYLSSLTETPADVPEVHGGFCIAEELVSGSLCTLEGFVFDKDVMVYEIIDSYRGPNQVSFEHYELPSRLPEQVRERMVESAKRVVQEIGLDMSPFNIEFFWDSESDAIRILEINPRISKSHCPLFYMVAGASHHEVPIDLTLGRRPDFPRREGRYAVAGKFMPRVYQDASVTHAPEPADIQRVKERFPETLINLHVKKGDQLSDLPYQDSYSYELADVFMGAESHEQLLANYKEAMKLLRFEFSESVDTNYGSGSR